jgi:kynureninase
MTDFTKTRAMFELPDGLVYLDGNSLGPAPKTAATKVAELVSTQWATKLIRGWNTAGWMEQPRTVGDRVARLIGAPADTVVMGDTLSIKVYQALASALALNPGRNVVLSDTGNFPSDLYMAQGLLRTMDNQSSLKLVEPEAVADAIDETVAVVMLTHVDYRTGRIHDMAELTRIAHEAGAITVWDLAHSAGALELDLEGTGADFAVGCTYKYLNGGPGAPAFIYVAPRHLDHVQPALSGWLGHASPFDFDLDYQAGEGIDRMRVGTPPVIALAALDAALDAWDDVDMADVRAQSIELSERFIAEVEQRCPQLELASPRDPNVRGSQVSFLFEHGYAAMNAISSHGVIGDFRAPNTMRFGFTPLYLSIEDVLRGVDILEDVISNRLWDTPEYHKRARVT